MFEKSYFVIGIVFCRLLMWLIEYELICMAIILRVLLLIEVLLSAYKLLVSLLECLLRKRRL